MACTRHSLACLALFDGTCVRARGAPAAAESACAFLDLKDQLKPQHQPVAAAVGTVLPVPAAAELEVVAEIVAAAAAVAVVVAAAAVAAAAAEVCLHLG